jgi:hypothetical protein
VDQVEVRRDAIYVPSDDIVAREIEGEVIIVPLTAGIGDMDDELYTFNDTGRAVWNKLDGERKLADVIDELAAEYDAEPDALDRDVTGLVAELVKRRIVVVR